ncbi:hypothetical protein KKA15_00505 [Patescibacteria group bacterium]|nr:hypothetical protein [Patescibacteria group bacterium]
MNQTIEGGPKPASNEQIDSPETESTQEGINREMHERLGKLSELAEHGFLDVWQLTEGEVDHKALKEAKNIKSILAEKRYAVFADASKKLQELKQSGGNVLEQDRPKTAEEFIAKINEV